MTPKPPFIRIKDNVPIMNQSEFSYLLIMANPKRQIPLEKEINPINANVYLLNLEFFKSLFF
tara:strand:- start:415 stop:600 length:186 start_codon:yes stop_codon:yes gene_type:complete